jgi:hypothetical protein
MAASIVTRAISWPHRAIRDDYCPQAEYCEYQQLPDPVFHSEHPYSSRMLDA